MNEIKYFLMSIRFASSLILLAGCAAASPESSSGSAANASQAIHTRIPRVADCGVLNTGSPSRFVCDGKVYTSFQLAKLREEEAKKYASGK